MNKGGNQKKNEEIISFSSEGCYLSGTEIPVWWARYIKKITGKMLHLNMYTHLTFVEEGWKVCIIRMIQTPQYLATNFKYNLKITK